jgi:hypothetical protein
VSTVHFMVLDFLLGGNALSARLFMSLVIPTECLS